MKKLVVIASMLVGSSVAMARGGEEGTRVPARGTQAWFVAESIEHSMRLAIAGNNALQAEISSASAEVTDNEALVSLGLASGESISFKCLMFDTTSRGGTVVKKDVNCLAN
jgi:hypothetical protein